MAISLPCPLCDGEVEFSVEVDGDDHRSWQYAEPKSDRCCVSSLCEGCVLTEAEWETLQAEADKRAAEYTWEPSWA